MMDFFLDLWWIDMDSDFWWILGDGWRFFLWILGEESATVLGGTSGVETNPSNFVGSRCAYTKLVSTKTHCRFMKYHSHRPWPWRTRCRLTLHCQRCGSTWRLCGSRIAASNLFLQINFPNGTWIKKKTSTWTSRNLKEILHEYAIFCWT